jgi:hypothetical protein
MSSRREAKMRAQGSRSVKRNGLPTPTLNDSAATGPTPGTVIRRRQVVSCWTTHRSTRCSPAYASQIARRTSSVVSIIVEKT